MPDDLPDDLDQDDPSDTGAIKALRHANRTQKARLRELEEQAAEAAAAKRELMFARAGVPIDDPKLKYFVRGYDGELTPDAIKAEYAATGFGNPSTTATPPPDNSRSDIDAMHRIAEAGAGAPAEDANDRQRYQDELNDVLNTVKDPYIAQAKILAIAAKYGSGARGQ